MKMPSITFAAFLAISLFCPTEAKGNDQHKKWTLELGAQDYQTRVKAMEEVWKNGEEALVFLEELAKGDDPEIAVRAATIAQKIKMGITPDTPQKVVDLINTYLKSPEKGQIAVLGKLRDIGAFDFILKLRRLETNQRVIAQMDGIFKKFMPQAVRSFLNEEKIADAKEILGWSDEYKHMIQLGDLLQFQG